MFLSCLAWEGFEVEAQRGAEELCGIFYFLFATRPFVWESTGVASKEKLLHQISQLVSHQMEEFIKLVRMFCESKSSSKQRLTKNLVLKNEDSQHKNYN